MHRLAVGRSGRVDPPFMISLIAAVVIVLLLLAVTMGVRAGIIMARTGIDLHRISQGAMIIVNMNSLAGRE